MRRWGIKHQVLLLALVPTIIISILFSAYFIRARLNDIEQSFRDRATTIAFKLASGAEYGVFSNNTSLLQNLAISALHEPGVQSVAFYTYKGKEIASTGTAEFSFIFPSSAHLEESIHMQENNKTSAFIVPITTYKETDDLRSEPTQTETKIGWLKVELGTHSVHSREYQILLHTGLIFLLGLSLAGLLAFKMGRSVTNPILKLAQTVERIEHGELNTRVKISSYRELQILESGINTMAASLENAHTELQKKIEQATSSLRHTLETIEVQNIELEIARRIAENANKIKSEFLADMSHEIRTPLNGLIGFINLLQKTELSQKQHEYILTIQKSSNNLLAIINDILDFSKIEAGKLRIQYAMMNIRDCIDETLNLLAPHANGKNLALIQRIQSNVPEELFCDSLRIKQIITNLVGNAIKFTEHGSVIISVHLAKETNIQTTLCVRVIDTGIGLSTEEQKTLFKPFNQTKSGTTHKLGGTGLGLVICKKLVEQMGGTIGVESEPLKGSTFWFTFQAEKHVPHVPTQRFLVAAPTPPNDSNKSFHILAVDDNPENLKLIKVLLEDLGFSVLAVESGVKAIEAVQTQTFHAILMDIRMPKMNGIEASHAIRTIESTHQKKPTPIIALTAHALVSEKKALLAAGIDDYLSKPIVEEELTNMIYKWIQKTEKQKTIDWDLARKLAGGKEDLAKELFEKLILSLPDDKTLMNEVYLRHDWETLRDHVHKLHGACCYCGVPELKRCASQLENALANQAYEMIQSLLEALNQAIERVLSEAKMVA